MPRQITVHVETGERFGRLVVSELTRYRNRRACVCVCDCGAVKTVSVSDLRSGRVKSCGCLNMEKIRMPKKHGDSHTRLFRIWCLMVERCRPTATRSTRNYGARGIRVCPEWKNYLVFKQWAITNGYSDSPTIERKDVDGDYCPDNCTWVPAARQVLNRRNTIRVQVGDEVKPLSEWCRVFCLNYHTVVTRLYHGWPIDMLLSPASHTTLRKRRTV